MVSVLISPVQCQDMAVLHSVGLSENTSIWPQFRSVTSLLEEPGACRLPVRGLHPFCPLARWAMLVSVKSASNWRASCPEPATGLISDTTVCFTMPFKPCFPNGLLPQALGTGPYLGILPPDGHMLVPPFTQASAQMSSYHSILKSLVLSHHSILLIFFLPL